MEEWQLKIAYFLVKHKKKIKKYFILFLVLLNLGVFSYFGYNLINYLIGSKEHEKMLGRLSQDIVAYEEYKKIHKPKDLEISDLTIIPLVSNRYDFLAQVYNPNEDWVIKNLKYRFTYDGGETEYKENFFLPQEKKIFLLLNFYSLVLAKNLNLEFKDIKWQRMTKKVLDELPKFTYNDIRIQNLKFISPGSIIEGKILSLGKTTFQIINGNAYNFWKATFKIILYQGKKIVGINMITIEKLLSNEIRNLEVSWPPQITYISSALIEPEINILDPNVIMPIR